MGLHRGDPLEGILLWGPQLGSSVGGSPEWFVWRGSRGSALEGVQLRWSPRGVLVDGVP
jgi:hypothetical protein